MTRTSERIEKIIEEVTNKPVVDEEQVVRQKLRYNVKMLKVYSNIHMVLTFFSLFGYYIAAVKDDLLSCFLFGLLFGYSLYHFLHTYFYIRVYSSKLIIHKKDGDDLNGKKFS